MIQDWIFNSQTFASWQVGKISGNKGLGFYQLNFPVAITTQPAPKGQPSITVTDLFGSLHARGTNSPSHPSLVGRLVANQSYFIRTSEYSGSHQVNLEVELDSARMEAIESIRLGGDLTFSVSLYGFADSQGNKQTLYRLPCDLPVGQSDWIKVLENVGYRKTALLEIPIPTGEINSVFSEAVAHLETAQKQMLRGHYREAVGACRDVLESLSRFLKNENNEIQTPKQKRSKEDRINAIKKAFYDLTSAAKHSDETTSQFEWSRADAVSSIRMAATLLQWAHENNS